jgi:hypothetical protein
MNLFSQTLDIRAEWAITRVLEVSDGMSERVGNAYQDAYESAYVVGMQAAANRLSYDVPLLFADVPDLRAGWKRGYVFEQECQDMRRCPNCNDGTGNPCRVHG